MSAAKGNTTPPVAYELIEDQAALNAFCQSLAESRLLAIDTEFVGEKTYYPVLELIQISDEHGRIGLIDARAITDPAPLAGLLADPEREKIVHAGGQDVAILYRLTGHAPVPMFDTQLAAAMVGVGAQVSYANLVQIFTGDELNKSHTISDWSQRPLSKGQLNYAAIDVVHLHELREKLLARLQNLGRTRWYREEQEARVESILEEVRHPLPDMEQYTAVKEWMKLKGVELAVLQHLAAWREEEARKRNEPRRRMMPDNALIGLARMAPTNRDQIKNARQLPQGPAFRFFDQYAPVIAKAKALPKEQWPKKPRPQRSDIPPGVVELMQAFVRTTADREQIASTLLATSGELNALANNRAEAETLDLQVLKGWRREMVGEQLIGLLDGRVVARIAERERLEFEPRLE